MGDAEAGFQHGAGGGGSRNGPGQGRHCGRRAERILAGGRREGAAGVRRGAVGTALGAA